MAAIHNGSAEQHEWFAQVRELTLRLVRFRSITNSQGEVEFAPFLADLLREHPYFQAHPEYVRVMPAPGDPFGRSNVFALVHGGPRTVLLCGHFDVVSTENYGELEPLACDPEALLPALIAELERDSSDPSDQLALRDLRSGDYLPGRGALDMKSGIAAGIAQLFRFAEQEQRTGSLLLVATPDEEQTSQGMRAAAVQLPHLLREWGLEAQAAINLDSTTDRGDGSAGQVIYLGSVGKLLPAVYVVGRDTHAGAPFDGVGATVLAAAITQAIECNPELADEAAGEVAPPPICLKQIDLKGHYDVTTPAAAWCYYNVLTYERSASQVLSMFVEVVQRALDGTLAELSQRAQRYAARGGASTEMTAWQTRVLTVAELREAALAHSGASVEQALAALDAQLPADLDLPSYSLRVIELLWKLSGLSGPAAVVGIGALHYPRVMVNEQEPLHVRLRAAVNRQTARLAQERGVVVRQRPFFSGISDMSFLGGGVSDAEHALIAANTPAWGRRIRARQPDEQVLAVPIINLGPWGRDYHQRIERVYMPYAFDVLPELIWRIAQDLLGQQEAME